MSIAKWDGAAYVIKADTKSVEASANVYIPFEPSGIKGEKWEETLRFRKDLREAIQRLRAEEDEILLASYSENEKGRFYDVENMLFYNIGTAAFSDCCKRRLAFRGDEGRVLSQGFGRTDIEPRFFYSYRLIKEKNAEALLAGKRAVASWKEVPVEMKIPHSAARYYEAVRKNANCIKVQGVLGEKAPFALRMKLILPGKSTAVSVTKALLDGVICAFHGDTEQTKTLCAGLFGEEKKSLEVQPLLGERDYLLRYRESSYKWNPEDERLQFAWISVEKGEKAVLSGTLYAWE